MNNWCYFLPWLLWLDFLTLFLFWLFLNRGELFDLFFHIFFDILDIFCDIRLLLTQVRDLFVGFLFFRNFLSFSLFDRVVFVKVVRLDTFGSIELWKRPRSLNFIFFFMDDLKWLSNIDLLRFISWYFFWFNHSKYPVFVLIQSHRVSSDSGNGNRLWFVYRLIHHNNFTLIAHWFMLLFGRQSSRLSWLCCLRWLSWLSWFRWFSWLSCFSWLNCLSLLSWLSYLRLLDLFDFLGLYFWSWNIFRLSRRLNVLVLGWRFRLLLLDRCNWLLR